MQPYDSFKKIISINILCCADRRVSLVSLLCDITTWFSAHEE